VISLIRTEDLVKDYALETQVVHALQGVSVTIQAGQNGDGHGTVRVRQAHFPDHPWLPRYAQRPRSAAYLEGRDVRLGLADGTVTEVLEGALSDQQDLIVGVSSATKQPAGPSGGARLGF
jgi:hypothetical protein